MKTYKIKITRQAREQLKAIRKYISEILMAPEAAKNTMESIKREIKTLDKMPERIKLTDEEPWRSNGIHQMHVRNYYVYFFIDEDNKRVQVTAVIFVSRDQAKQLSLMKME